jgi:hypothetical protein
MGIIDGIIEGVIDGIIAGIGVPNFCSIDLNEVWEGGVIGKILV